MLIRSSNFRHKQLYRLLVDLHLHTQIFGTVETVRQHDPGTRRVHMVGTLSHSSNYGLSGKIFPVTDHVLR